MSDQVNFTLGGDICSRYWGYTAYYGATWQKTASAELRDNQYTVFILGTRKDISVDSNPNLYDLDSQMYAAVKQAAEKQATVLRTTINDRATEDRTVQLVGLVAKTIDSIPLPTIRFA